MLRKGFAASIVLGLAACTNPQAPLTTLATSSGGTAGSSTTGSSSTSGTSGGGRFACHLGDAGLFGSPLRIVTGIGPYRQINLGQPRPLAVGDLDGDGILDIAEGDYLSEDLGILLGNGDGSFRPVVHADAGLWPVNLLITHAGRPAKPFLVVSSGGTNQPSLGPVVAEVDSLGLLSVIANPALLIEPQGTFAADLNGDGLTDLVVEGEGRQPPSTPYEGFQVLLGSAPGEWVPGSFVSSLWANLPDVIGDFNDDGIPDLIVGIGDDGTHSFLVYLGNGDGTFSDAGIETTSPMEVVVWSSGDLNEDGHLDLLAHSGDIPDYVLFGRGDGTFDVGPSVSLAYSDSSAAWPHALYDLNGDGHLDFIGADWAGALHVALGNGDGTFAPETLLSVAPADGGASYVGVVVGDVNGDGRLDLIANSFTDGSVTIFLNQCRE